jgi:CBS domain-containing protein
MRRVETGTECRYPAWLAFVLGPGRLARDYTASHARRVGEVMTREVITMAADAPLDEAVRMMRRHRVKRLPVVGSRGLQGILSRADLLRAFVDAMPEETPRDLSDAAIASRIARALDTQAWASRQSVRVEVRGGVVTLRGVLVNDAVRDALVVLVENMAGVTRVDDQLVTVEPLTGTVVRLAGEPGR